MKNKRLAIILGATLACTTIITSGCSDKTIGFRTISKDKAINGETIQEVVDEDTGVHYYVNTCYQQGAMCPVYNSDGTVKVDKEK